ncbi:MAG: hypothetical protein L0Y57_02610 [Beijerinckiaceae bacterium]|nr:hypothetical protein [Beijerinckiaceae bacterium]
MDVRIAFLETQLVIESAMLAYLLANAMVHTKIEAGVFRGGMDSARLIIGRRLGQHLTIHCDDATSAKPETFNETGTFPALE